jgi:hypothetical protein
MTRPRRARPQPISGRTACGAHTVPSPSRERGGRPAESCASLGEGSASTSSGGGAGPAQALDRRGRGGRGWRRRGKRALRGRTLRPLLDRVREVGSPLDDGRASGAPSSPAPAAWDANGRGRSRTCSSVGDGLVRGVSRTRALRRRP